MPKIIAIHSYRGGTGKSNLTANLVTAVALTGKRVAVIDTDIQSPGIHNIFDLDRGQIKYTLNDYLWGRSPIEAAACDVSLQRGVEETGRIFLIPSSVDSNEIARILTEGYNVSLLNEGVRQLVNSLQLDYLFIDTHPGLNKEVFLSIAISNILIVILRPDKQDFQGTAVTIDLARQLMVPQIMLVVNKVVKNMDWLDLQEQVENSYQAPVAAIFPASEEMMQLGSYGVFCQVYPDHIWTQTLIDLAGQIMDD